MAEQAKKHGWAVHAWCLMTNHVHLLGHARKPREYGADDEGARAAPCAVHQSDIPP
ncbi:hypothetical protein ABRP29_07620 [Pseudomonas sp. WHRI 8822A]|uniref:hypothetical protein n=1 Tax=Pseudomonas sp. WHRI 8822A TaxID=3162568 RepID=UPI0032EE487F